jgi:hypothetical protein
MTNINKILSAFVTLIFAGIAMCGIVKLRMQPPAHSNASDDVTAVRKVHEIERIEWDGHIWAYIIGLRSRSGLAHHPDCHCNK